MVDRTTGQVTFFELPAARVRAVRRVLDELELLYGEESPQHDGPVLELGRAYGSMGLPCGWLERADAAGQLRDVAPDAVFKMWEHPSSVAQSPGRASVSAPHRRLYSHDCDARGRFIYTPDELVTPEVPAPGLAWWRQERELSRVLAAATSRARLVEEVLPTAGLLCDDCWPELTGQSAVCADGCARPPDHAGVCDGDGHDEARCAACGRDGTRLTDWQDDSVDTALDGRDRIVVRALVDERAALIRQLAHPEPRERGQVATPCAQCPAPGESCAQSCPTQEQRTPAYLLHQRREEVDRELASYVRDLLDQVEGLETGQRVPAARDHAPSQHEPADDADADADADADDERNLCYPHGRCPTCGWGQRADTSCPNTEDCGRGTPEVAVHGDGVVHLVERQTVDGLYLFVDPDQADAYAAEHKGAERGTAHVLDHQAGAALLARTSREHEV